MSKRKRDEVVTTTDSRSVRIRQSRFQERFEQSCTTLQRALKLARTFERQKLSRRQKNAENNPQELLRLREEVVAVKQLDLGRTSRNYLIRRLSKAKRVKESAEFTALLGGEVHELEKEVKGSAEVTVVARLVNSNPAKEVMPGIIDGVFDVLGLEAIVPAGKGSAGRGSTEKKSAGNSTAGTSTLKKSAHQPAATIAALREAPQRPAEIESQDLTQRQHTGQERSSGSKNPLHREKPLEAGRLTPVEFESESDSIHSEGGELSEPEMRDGVQRDVILQSDPSRSASESSGESASRRPRTWTTTFLPSLMGGYISGSDSDTDFSDSGANGQNVSQPRKNRRGQRARRQIFEQKYGNNANHLRGQPESGLGRDRGWDIRRGATDAAGPGKSYEQKWKRGKTGGNFRVTGANLETVAPRTKPDKPDKPDKPLHPSWVAAQRKKSQGQPPGSMLKGMFQGTKISFD